MKRFLSVLIVLVFFPSIIFSQKLIEVGKGYSSTAVNAIVFRNSSLTTFKNTQYIAFYDSERYVVLGKRKLNSSKWELRRSQYTGLASDAHNTISIMVDGDGFLHVAFDHHVNKLNYCKSVTPGSIVLGPKESMVGKDEERVTYPEFYRLSNGDLLFFYRSGASGDGNLVLNKYDLRSKKWIRVQDNLIDGQGKRNAYWQTFVDKSDKIYLSWVWRETYKVESNHDLCYAYSSDYGKTWYKSSGEKYSLPISSDNAEYACRIPQNSGLINQTSMSVDDEGCPYIVTYWKDKGSNIPQYRLVWNDGIQWKITKINNIANSSSLKGNETKKSTISRPRILIDKKNVILIFRAKERGNKVSMAYSTTPTDTNWKIKDLTDFSVGSWEPSFDTELWKEKRKLNIYVQETAFRPDSQEKKSGNSTPVYVLEVNNLKF